MDVYYNRIMALPDTFEIKEVVRSWRRLSDRLSANKPAKDVILPDILMVAKYGVGKTHLLHLLSEFLYSHNNLMDFYGDVKVFEFYVNYCAPANSFTEISRLMAAVSSAAGFRNEYRGMICLDIQDWIDHFEEKHFIDLLEYLSDNSDHWLIVFSVSGDFPEKLKNLEAVLSMFLRIERVDLALPSPTSFTEYIQAKLHEYDLELDNDAFSLLEETVSILCSHKYFDGYKTMNMLVRDIVYHVFSQAERITGTLSAQDLHSFSKNGDYVQKRLLQYTSKKRLIGFNQGDHYD